MERMPLTLHGIDYEVISFEIIPHPDPALRVMGYVCCVVLVEEDGDSPSQPLKLTFARNRQGMEDWEMQKNAVSLAEEALARDKERVLGQQSELHGYFVTEL